MATIIIGQVTTRHFDFHVIGNSKVQCLEALWKAWQDHCRQFGVAASDSSFPTMADLDESVCWLTATTLPVVFRDGVSM